MFGRTPCIERVAFALQCMLGAHVEFYEARDGGRVPLWLEQVIAPEGVLPLIGERLVLARYLEVTGEEMPVEIGAYGDSRTGLVCQGRAGGWLGGRAVMHWVIATVMAIDMAAADKGALSRRLRWLAARLCPQRTLAALEHGLPPLSAWLLAMQEPECPPLVRIEAAKLVEVLREERLPLPAPGESAEEAAGAEGVESITLATAALAAGGTR